MTELNQTKIVTLFKLFGVISHESTLVSFFPKLETCSSFQKSNCCLLHTSAVVQFQQLPSFLPLQELKMLGGRWWKNENLTKTRNCPNFSIDNCNLVWKIDNSVFLVVFHITMPIDDVMPLKQRSHFCSFSIFALILMRMMIIIMRGLIIIMSQFLHPHAHITKM